MRGGQRGWAVTVRREAVAGTGGGLEVLSAGDLVTAQRWEWGGGRRRRRGAGPGSPEGAPLCRDGGTNGDRFRGEE